ncbi:unnamed protein product [Aspergillus niger]|nr:unnamed protein product [Aspergillus niger]
MDKALALGFAGRGIAWRKSLADDGLGNKRMGDILAHLSFPRDSTPLDGTDAILYLRHVITPLEKPQEGEKTLFRCAVALDPKDTRSDEELLSEDSLSSLLGEMMPGPRPLPARVVRSSPYRIHQLCASTFHRGRCILAGDAAHLNNPVGALGLTTGILDAEAAADALELIINEGKQLEALRIYSHARQKAFQTFVNPVSTANKLRIANDPEAATEDWFLRAMLDPTPETIEEFTKPFFGIWRTNMREEMRRRQL